MIHEYPAVQTLNKLKHLPKFLPLKIIPFSSVLFSGAGVQCMNSMEPTTVKARQGPNVYVSVCGVLIILKMGGLSYFRVERVKT